MTQRRTLLLALVIFVATTASGCGSRIGQENACLLTRQSSCSAKVQKNWVWPIVSLENRCLQFNEVFPEVADAGEFVAAAFGKEVFLIRWLCCRT